MASDDAESVARLKAGDPSGLETLYRRYVERVWRYGWFRTRSREAAAEIVQETFLRVARSIGSFEGRSAFGTWLFAITRRVAIEHGRRERRDRETIHGPTILRLVPAVETPDSLEAEDARDAVRRAMADLPAAQRDVVVLCEFSGLNMCEAAEALGWGESRVKVTLHRARRRLRETLSDFAGDDAARTKSPKGANYVSPGQRPG